MALELGQTPINQSMNPQVTKQCLLRFDPKSRQLYNNPFNTYQGIQQQTEQAVNKNYSFGGVKVEAPGIDGYNEKDANQLLLDSEKYKKWSAYANIGSSVLNMYNAYQYARDVKKSKVQYENQKKIIDANIANQETLMMENLQENMAQLDVMTAAKNVDLSSEGIQAIKDKGLADMGEDIRTMREQGALNKKALDLDYAMNLKSARQQFTNSVIAGGFNIGTSLYDYTR